MLSSKTKKKILLIEDHPIVSQGLVMMINQQTDLMACGIAEDSGSALAKISEFKPDLITVDISLKTGNGVELVKDIKAFHPKALILMLSMHDENLYAIRALRAGAAGYVMKNEAAEVVLNAMRQVLAGEIYVSRSIEKQMTSRLILGRTAKTGSSLEDLSDRELEVFRLLGQGFGTRQISEKLHLSIKTIESHRAHIKEKLNLSNAAQLVQHAVQWASAV